MKNPVLANLNFRKLLHYGSAPEVRGLSTPIPCSGFCVSCEKNGFLDAGDHRLDQMSHGADTEDFERAICELPSEGIDTPVAFLLESPGGYYSNGIEIDYEGITKKPPVNCYYWTPRKAELPMTGWPTKPSEVEGSYGPYFAYILAKYNLHNAYFTNIIKCSLAMRDADQFVGYYVVTYQDNRDSKIRANCYNQFLREEMRILNPHIIFYFGQKATKMGNYAGLHYLLPAAQFVTLYHPAARYVSPSQIISRNDELIREALSKTHET